MGERVSQATILRYIQSVHVLYSCSREVLHMWVHVYLRSHVYEGQG